MYTISWKNAARSLLIAAIFATIFSSCLPKQAGTRQSGPKKAELATLDFTVVRPADDDTFQSLAARYLGDPEKGWLIARYNGLKSLEPGKLLVVPSVPLYRGGLDSQGFQTVPILTYHKFSIGSSDRMTVKADDFERQMRYLKENGYRTVGLDQLLDFMEFKSSLPEKAVVISIDDGWLSAYEIAYPILKEYGFQAVLFLYTDFVDGPKALSWDQVEEMSRNGFDIQNHTRTHRDLTRIKKGESFEQYLREIERELDDAKKAIEEHTGAKCNYLAYPFGRTDSLVNSLVRKKGYRAAFTMERGSAPFFSKRYDIGRSVVYGEFDLDEFVENLTVWEAFAANAY